jgi:hypothetical protein
MLEEEYLDDIEVVQSWRTQIASFLSKFTTAVMLSEIERSFPRPSGVPSKCTLEMILQNDPFERFAVSGTDASTRARRIYRVDDTEIRESVLEWQESLAEFLSNQGSAVSLSDLGSQIVRPNGVPISVKLIDVLKTDPLNRFIITNDANGGAKAQYNYANLTDEQVTSLQEQWRDNVSRFLSNYSTSLSIDDIANYVSRPPYLDESVTLLDILKSDKNGCFAISGELPNIRVRRVYRVDDPTIASYVEDWRTAVSSFLASQSVSVSLSDIGSSIARPPNLPASVKLIDVLRADDQQRFVLSGDGNNIRAALSTSARQRVMSPSLLQLSAHRVSNQPVRNFDSDPSSATFHPSAVAGRQPSFTPESYGYQSEDHHILSAGRAGYGPSSNASISSANSVASAGSANTIGSSSRNNSLNNLQNNLAGNGSLNYFGDIPRRMSPAPPAPPGVNVNSLPMNRSGSPRVPFAASPTPPRPGTYGKAMPYGSGGSGSRMGVLDNIDDGRFNDSFADLSMMAGGLQSKSRVSPAGTPTFASANSRSDQVFTFPSPKVPNSSSPVVDGFAKTPLVDWVPDSSTPAEFVCPICRQIMKDPVTCVDGYTYDKGCVEGIIMSMPRNSPYSGSYKIISRSDTLKNNILRYLLDRRNVNKHDFSLNGSYYNGNSFVGIGGGSPTSNSASAFGLTSDGPHAKTQLGLLSQGSLLGSNMYADMAVSGPPVNTQLKSLSSKAIGPNVSPSSAAAAGTTKPPTGLAAYDTASVSSLSNHSLLSLTSNSPASTTSSFFGGNTMFDNSQLLFGLPADLVAPGGGVGGNSGNSSAVIPSDLTSNFSADTYSVFGSSSSAISAMTIAATSTTSALSDYNNVSSPSSVSTVGSYSTMVTPPTADRRQLVDLTMPIDVWMRSVFAGFDVNMINMFSERFRHDAGFATVADMLESYAQGQLTLDFVAHLANFKLGHHNRLVKALESLAKSLSN